MRTFYVLWTYIANFSRLMPVRAETAEEAYMESCGHLSEDFRAKATVYVFDAPPALIVYKGEGFHRMGDTATRFTHNVDRAHVDAYREKSKGDR